MQVVSSELATASHHGGQARDEVGLLRSRLAATEQLLRSKEAEVEDVRHAYEGLAVEHRRAQSTLLQVGVLDVGGAGGVGRVGYWRFIPSSLCQQQELASLTLFAALLPAVGAGGCAA